MKYFTAVKIGTALAKARVAANLSQREMAIHLQKSERTVQSWEKGLSNPRADEIMDWFTVCKSSPLAAFQEMLHPELYQKPIADMTDEELESHLEDYFHTAPRIVKEMLLFGSYPPAVIAEVCANLHTPLQSKVSVCGQVLDNYEFSISQNVDPVPGGVQPPIELVRSAYNAGKEAARRGETAYLAKRGESK